MAFQVPCLFQGSISGCYTPTQVTQIKLEQIKIPNQAIFHVHAWGLIHCSAGSRERHLFASIGHSKRAFASTWSLIDTFWHITWYFAMKTFYYTCLKLYLLDLLLISAFSLHWQGQTVSEESLFLIQVHKTGKCFRFDVTTAHCHLGICCCQLFPPQTLCQSAYVFAGRLSSSLSKLKSTSHTGMHTHCFKYHKQMIPQAFSKHLKKLFSFIG